MKYICSEEEELHHKLLDLVNRGYRAEIVRRKIQKINAIDRQASEEKRPKIQEVVIF